MGGVLFWAIVVGVGVLTALVGVILILLGYQRQAEHTLGVIEKELRARDVKSDRIERKVDRATLSISQIHRVPKRTEARTVTIRRPSGSRTSNWRSARVASARDQ
jgi:hypothetical protein